MQSREDGELDEELAELLEEVDEPQPPTEAGGVVQAAAENQVLLQQRDAILRSTASHLAAVSATLNGEQLREFLAHPAAQVLVLLQAAELAPS